MSKDAAVIALKELSTGAGAGRIVFQVALEALDIAGDVYIESLNDYTNGVGKYYQDGLISNQDTVTSNHFKMYHDDLKAGRRVIVVAHSQGNLFANSVVGTVIAEDPDRFENSIGVVGVASPAGYLLKQNNDYVTADDDRVIDALRVTHYVLPSNINNDPGVWNDYRDWPLNHGFTTSYLASELESDYTLGDRTLRSRAVIDRMFLDLLAKLEYPLKRNPIVTSVFPEKATLNQTTTFTVTGQHLPSTLDFLLEDCLDVTPTTSWVNSETSRKFTCTPSGIAGLKSLEVKEAPECEFLYGRYVDFVDASEPTSCPSGNGYYCGKSSLGQNTNSLYYCQDGNYQVREQCSDGCETMPTGFNDKCY
ncbi:MAG: hypothetical protein D3924_17125 [Candidatus Electrothrix sp. AR4]|nr:hypothetical protein [Candidatus Electrothrix sp. AR4]